MGRNCLIASHGYLTRQDAPMSGLRDILYAAFIVIVIAVAFAGFYG
jgi:FtsH-binding integral membrane protein